MLKLWIRGLLDTVASFFASEAADNHVEEPNSCDTNFSGACQQRPFHRRH
jgi:hypothetical protein